MSSPPIQTDEPSKHTMRRLRDYIAGYDAGLKIAAKEARRLGRHFKKAEPPDPAWKPHAEAAAVVLHRLGGDLLEMRSERGKAKDRQKRKDTP